jgi:hypothetical protein
VASPAARVVLPTPPFAATSAIIFTGELLGFGPARGCAFGSNSLFSRSPERGDPQNRLPLTAGCAGAFIAGSVCASTAAA